MNVIVTVNAMENVIRNLVSSCVMIVIVMILLKRNMTIGWLTPLHCGAIKGKGRNGN